MTAIGGKGEASGGSTGIRTFAFTYLIYAAYYLTRLNFSAMLPSMGSELGYPKLLLGLMGGAFSAVYAIGLIVNGRIAERFGAKKLITFGLAVSATANILFSFADNSIAMILLWSINGYAQSTGWPSAVKIISDWFSGGSRGKVGGIFGTCFLVGSMAALMLSGSIQAEFGWRAAFILPSIAVIASIIPFNLFVTERITDGSGHGEKPDRRSRRPILSREVLTIVAAYVLLQIVRSGLSLWAPTFLFENQAIPLIYASYGAAIIPLGGVIGSILSGWASDRFNRSRRIPIMVFMTAVLCFILLLLHGQLGSVGSVSLLFFSGLALYGPHVILSTIIPMDRNRSYGAANLASFIDSLGYVGMMFADPFIGWIVDCRGWGDAIAFWTLSSVCTTLLLMTLWGEEDRQE